MILDFLGVTTSVTLLVLPLAVIGHAFRSHWRQIAMALNAEIPLAPDPIPPVRLGRIRPVQTPPPAFSRTPSPLRAAA